MATEIIVVVEDENARGRSGGATVEERGCQAADATPDDDEVILFLDRQPLESENFASPRLRVRCYAKMQASTHIRCWRRESDSSPSGRTLMLADTSS